MIVIILVALLDHYCDTAESLSQTLLYWEELSSTSYKTYNSKLSNIVFLDVDNLKTKYSNWKTVSVKVLIRLTGVVGMSVNVELVSRVVHQHLGHQA